MTASSSVFVAGHFQGTWDGADLGTTEVGYNITPVYANEPIRVDELGDTQVDGIYRGYNLRLDFEMIQWGASARQALQFPFDTSLGVVEGVGKPLMEFAKTIVLTPVSGINTSNKTITFHKCVPDGQHGGFQLNTKNRRVRCNMLILADIATGRLFTQAT